MSDAENGARSAGWKDTLWATLAWILSTALLFLDLAVARNTVRALAAWIGDMSTDSAMERIRAGWTLGAVDKFFVLFLGVVGIGLVVFFEHYYGKGADEGVLFQRVVRVISIQIIVAVVGLGIQVML